MRNRLGTTSALPGPTMSHSPRIAVLAVFLFCACISLPEVEQVPETPDAGEPDAHAEDSGTLDASVSDSGTPDSGTPDSGTPDSGTPDSGAPTLTVTLVTSRAVTNSDVQVSGTVTGAVPDEVELLVDGAAVATLAPPYELRWSAQSLDEGTHVLALRASLEGRRFTSESRTLIVDRTPPRLVMQTPLTGAQFISVHQVVQATFSEPLDPATVRAESVKLLSDAGVIAAEVALASEGTSLTIQPTSLLPADTAVQVRFESSVVDLAGNAVQALPEHWTWAVPGFLPLGEPLSASPTERSLPRSPSLQIDGAGRPVVAWVGGTGAESPYGVRVRRWNGSGWEQLGGVLEVPVGSNSSFCSLTIDADGRSIVVWDEVQSSTVATSMHTRRWNGSAWDVMGDVPLRQQSSADLIVSKGNKQGQIALAFVERYQGNDQVLVSRWNGTSWGMVGGGLKVNSSWMVSGIQLAIDAAGNPVVAWSESNSGNIAAFMRRWNGSAWEAIAMPAQTFPGALFIDAAGAPILDVRVWNGTAWSAQLRQWNGSTWATLGSTISLYPGTTDSSVVTLTLDVQGRLIALLGEQEAAGGATVFYIRRWNAGAWEPVGSLLRKNSGDNFIGPALLAMDSTNRPFMARREAPENDVSNWRIHVYTPND
ncbi:Ig-like domain-containing protein [Pyxidicoccus parkwayensis]|uniref:Ig-like domain-containing protein n=1 Tax=Pyxidicoccus parkwayensis TaxID=2813578 RepID=A0ABX7NQ64_9BACT|nr:Ig-like domain-containing protein [Pyxidicoccus parkwaysis]QSQ20823.1 Ig-like domain-containing protein [Pyxidicoccus parkwaysis]